jgi:hypothetical protein
MPWQSEQKTERIAAVRPALPPGDSFRSNSSSCCRLLGAMHLRAMEGWRRPIVSGRCFQKRRRFDAAFAGCALLAPSLFGSQRIIVDLWFMPKHSAIVAGVHLFRGASFGGGVVRVFGVIATSIVTFGAYALSGCVQVPFRDGVAAADINSVVRRIKCDLSEVVLREAYRYDEYGERPFLFLRSWAAKIHLALIVDDMGSINPNFNTTLFAKGASCRCISSCQNTSFGETPFTIATVLVSGSTWRIVVRMAAKS